MSAAPKSEKQNPLNLYQKLVQVRKQVPYIQKTGEGYGYSYATEYDILSKIREKMDELNVFLEIDMVSLENIDVCEIKNKVVHNIPGVKATFEFMWINADNPTENIKKKLIVQDSESGISTVGGLMTYANRYFLYKFFSVATDKMDPDSIENSRKKEIETPPEAAKKTEPPKTVNHSAPAGEKISIAQTIKIDSLAQGVPERLKVILKSYGISSSKEIPAADFDRAVKYLTTGE